MVGLVMAGKPGATRLRALSWPKVGQSVAAGVAPAEGGAVVVELGAADVGAGGVDGWAVGDEPLVHAPRAAHRAKAVSARAAAVQCMRRVCGRPAIATRRERVAI